MSNYPDLDSCLFDLFFIAVSSEVSNFAATEICFVIVTLLAFFLRKSVMSLSLGLSVFSLLLYLASYNSIAVLVISAALFPCVSQRWLELSLLLGAFLQAIVDARS